MFIFSLRFEPSSSAFFEGNININAPDARLGEVSKELREICSISGVGVSESDKTDFEAQREPSVNSWPSTEDIAL